jgi:DNA-binding MarR family transcriptional regulator
VSTAARTTLGLVGDFLASLPAGQSVIVKNLAKHLERDRAGVTDAISKLVAAKAVSSKADPEDLRRTIAYMTADQQQAWKGDAGAAVAAVAGLNLEVRASAAKAAEATRQAAADRRDQQLRFGVWNDGALAIEGLARKQLTLPAEATGSLAATLASLPEGALQALFESPLKPVFTLQVEGRDYPLTTEQAAALVAYIEQLPSKALRVPLVPGFKPGTDHRSHRIDTPADQED